MSAKMLSSEYNKLEFRSKPESKFRNTFLHGPSSPDEFPFPMAVKMIADEFRASCSSNQNFPTAKRPLRARGRTTLHPALPLASSSAVQTANASTCKWLALWNDEDSHSLAKPRASSRGNPRYAATRSRTTLLSRGKAKGFGTIISVEDPVAKRTVNDWGSILPKIPCERSISGSLKGGT